MLKIGDIYKNGIIFDLDKGGIHGLISEKQDLGIFNWYDAIDLAKCLVENWRLPTKNELLKIYDKQDLLGFFAQDFYYSSEKDLYGVWALSWGSGSIVYIDGNELCRVRLVKEF